MRYVFSSSGATASFGDKDVIRVKIERISDTQVKFVLESRDLLEKNIKITELAYGSEKTQVLFREMLERAYDECGFEVENVPIMIEAIPVAVDSIIIIVTKVANGDDIEAKFNSFLPKTRDFGKSNKNANDIGKYFGATPNTNDEANARPLKPLGSNALGKQQKASREKVYVYSFKRIDDAIDLCARLTSVYTGHSSMYKYNDKYFMVFDNEQGSRNIRGFENILSEYGARHVSGQITKYHLIEHGETMIATNAVHVLAKI